MTRHARHRLRIAVLVILSLLFQQVALAAYLCPTEPMPAKAMAMSEHCDGMGMAKQEPAPALCQKHCNPDQSTVGDAVKLTVPPLSLPAPVLALAQEQSASCVSNWADVPVTRSDPPPRLRFCSLQI